MPYKTGQDVGGLGRLMEAQRWQVGQERLDAQEARTSELQNLQMDAARQNIAEVKRGKEFQAQYMQALTQSKPGESYNTGTKWLNNYANTNPQSADLAYKAMKELDEKESDVLDSLKDMGVNPKQINARFNGGLGKKMGIRAEDAGTHPEWGDLKSLYDNDGNMLGLFRIGANGQPEKISDLSTEKPPKKEKGQFKIGLNPTTNKWEHVNFVDDRAVWTGVEAKAPTNQSLSVDADGTVTFSTGNQTKGRTKADQEYAKEYVSYIAKGGHADNEKLLIQLKEAQTELASGSNITGPEIGLQPKTILSMSNPVAVNVRERIEETVQRNLRAVLGAQFTEKEGERLIARAFNPMLPEHMNVRRLNLLINQMSKAYEVQRDAAQYFEQNGSLTGWKGTRYTIDDFDKIDFSQADKVETEDVEIDNSGIKVISIE